MAQIGYNQERANAADSGGSKDLPDGIDVYQFTQVKQWTNSNTGETSHIFEFQHGNGATYSYWCNFEASGFIGDKAHKFYRMFCLASGVEDSVAAISNFDTEIVAAREYQIEVHHAENKKNPEKPYVNIVSISPHNAAQQHSPHQQQQQQQQQSGGAPWMNQ